MLARTTRRVFTVSHLKIEQVDLLVAVCYLPLFIDPNEGIFDAFAVGVVAWLVYSNRYRERVLLRVLLES